MRVTALLLSFERQANLVKIIDCIRNQTEPVQTFLWNNCLEDKTQYNVDLQINSSANLMCWPRWFMANYADTDYVFSLDDDLNFRDNRIIQDCINYLDENQSCDAIGCSGVQILNKNSPYSNQRHIFPQRQDEPVDILKGNFIFSRRGSIHTPKIKQPVSLVDARIEDDIMISSTMNSKIVPAFLRKRLIKLSGFSNGLHAQPEHPKSRTDYMRQYYE